MEARYCQNTINEDLGDALGKIYVAKYFPPSSKAAVQEMVKNLLAGFDHRIDALSWMTPATKAQAKAKLKTLRSASAILRNGAIMPGSLFVEMIRWGTAGGRRNGNIITSWPS